jgi:hypothetical protein
LIDGKVYFGSVIVAEVLVALVLVLYNWRYHLLVLWQHLFQQYKDGVLFCAILVSKPLSEMLHLWCANIVKQFPVLDNLS